MNELPSEKITRFLESTETTTPFVVVDVDLVEQRYRQLSTALPGTGIFYAVKANPARPILERLHELGSSFDVASPGEIDMCLEVGVNPADISYGNTIKKRRDVAYAYSVGVRKFAIDAITELDKVVNVAPGASVCVRLQHESAGADWPLSRKFGCDPADVVHLLCEAHAAGMATGVSFHVGSQQRDVMAWDDTLEVVADIFRRATERGATPTSLNLGGGFPGSYRESAPDIATYGTAVRAAVAALVPRRVTRSHGRARALSRGRCGRVAHRSGVGVRAIGR